MKKLIFVLVIMIAALKINAQQMYKYTIIVYFTNGTKDTLITNATEIGLSIEGGGNSTFTSSPSQVPVLYRRWSSAGFDVNILAFNVTHFKILSKTPIRDDASRY